MLNLADVVNIVLRDGNHAEEDVRLTVKFSKNAGGQIDGIDVSKTPSPVPEPQNQTGNDDASLAANGTQQLTPAAQPVAGVNQAPGRDAHRAPND